MRHGKLTRVVALFLAGGALAYGASPRESLRQLCDAAAAGDPKALYDLAYLYDIGYDSIPRDSAVSTRLYLESAEKGYLPAQNYIGFRLIKGEAVERDPVRGLEWLRQAAVKGDAKAANNLGWLLMDGTLVEQDYTNAAFWLGKAAEAGLPVAMSQLADLYRQGLGVDVDSVRAASLYSQAIEGGLHDAELKLLSMQYDNWRVLSPSEALELARHYNAHGAPVIAVTLLEIASEGDAADSADVATLAEAYTGLAEAYTLAKGVGYDHDRALAYYVRGAVLGSPEAARALAELLEILPDSLEPFYQIAVDTASRHSVHVPSATEFKSPEYWSAQAGS